MIKNITKKWKTMKTYINIKNQITNYFMIMQTKMFIKNMSQKVNSLVKKVKNHEKQIYF